MTNANDPINPVVAENYGGLTKRELFAVMAMRAIIPGNRVNPVPFDEVLEQPRIVAEWAILYADALIAELNKPTP